MIYLLRVWSDDGCKVARMRFKWLPDALGRGPRRLELGEFSQYVSKSRMLTRRYILMTSLQKNRGKMNFFLRRSGGRPRGRRRRLQRVRRRVGGSRARPTNRRDAPLSRRHARVTRHRLHRFLSRTTPARWLTRRPSAEGLARAKSAIRPPWHSQVRRLVMPAPHTITSTSWPVVPARQLNAHHH